MTPFLMNIPHAGQVPVGADRSAPDFGGLNDTKSTFNRYYLNWLPKDNRELMAMAALTDRLQRSRAMVAGGAVVDYMIQVITLDPFAMMTDRLTDGLLGVKPLELADFSTTLGDPRVTDGNNYDRTPYMSAATLPPNAIKVSLKLADYPVAGDLQMRPLPFSPWATKFVFKADGSIDKDGIGTRYEALNQRAAEAPEAPWVNYVERVLPIGAVYEEVWTIRSGALFPGGELRPYIEFVRIK